MVELLLLGIAPELESEIRKKYAHFLVQRSGDRESFQKLLLQKPPRKFHLAFLGDHFKGVEPGEIAQSLRMMLPDCTLISLSTRPQGFDRALLQKYGFHHVFLLPQEDQPFVSTLGQVISKAEIQAHTPVPLVALNEDSSLEFPIKILIHNTQKISPLFEAGEKLDLEKLSRLNSFRNGHAYVAVKDLPQFYKFSAQKLYEQSGGSKDVPPEGPNLPLLESVRELIGSLSREAPLKKSKSKLSILEHTQEIVHRFFELKSPDLLFKKVSSELPDKGETLRRQNRVACYAALFALALRCPNPMEAAIAGLFREIGLQELPLDLREKDQNGMSPKELELYQSYPRTSAKILKNKRLSLPAMIYDAIELHRERWSGQGFPNKFRGARLNLTTQVVILATRFDELTRIEANLTPLSMEAALEKMSLEVCISPDLMNSLKYLFEKMNQSA